MILAVARNCWLLDPEQIKPALQGSNRAKAAVPSEQCPHHARDALDGIRGGRKMQLRMLEVRAGAVPARRQSADVSLELVRQGRCERRSQQHDDDDSRLTAAGGVDGIRHRNQRCRPGQHRVDRRRVLAFGTAVEAAQGAAVVLGATMGQALHAPLMRHYREAQARALPVTLPAAPAGAHCPRAAAAAALAPSLIQLPCFGPAAGRVRMLRTVARE